ncbi:MAG: GGDEF domain-containing protein [Thermoanaerobaculia bacterium]
MARKAKSAGGSKSPARRKSSKGAGSGQSPEIRGSSHPVEGSVDDGLRPEEAGVASVATDDSTVTARLPRTGKPAGDHDSVPHIPLDADGDETWIANRDDRERRSPAGSEISARRASLVVIAHPDRTMLGSSFSIFPGTAMTIGRSADVEIGFPDVMEVSRRHARIIRNSDETIIEDLGSRNGTLVNGAYLDRACNLASGDVIELQVVKLKFLEGDDLEHGYHEALYHLTILDELTGIFNRRRYDAEVDRDFARSRRHGTPLSLIIFDIDGFKSINDEYGHPAGDAVLQQMARLVEQHIRREEIFARSGGDEFLILCPDVPLSGATTLAEKLRARVAANEFDLGSGTIPVTCSFGVAGISPAMKSPEELYAAADRELYRSKQKGRNAVSSAE